MAPARAWALRLIRVSRPDGFTLTEILVVIAILSVLAAIAIPNWSTLLPTYALNSAARQVQSELHNAKARAAAQNYPHRLSFSASSYAIEKDAGSGWQSTGENKALPEGITVAGTSDMILTLSPRGTSSDSTDKTVKLCNNKGAGKNVVLSSTGRIRIDNATC